MQDRFKFRAYNFLSKKYTYFDEPETQFAERNSTYLCGLIMPLLDEKQSLYFGKYEFQQCTGLKDKNGNLIYEGDILKLKTLENFDVFGTNEKYVEIIALIVFEYGGFFIEQPENGIFLGQIPKSELEIIGNIYENPKLIGGAECTQN